MTGENPPPYAVSPVIRGARWTAFAIGIFYGLSKHAIYSKKAAKERVISEEMKQIRDAEIAEEKLIQAEKEKRALDLLSPPKQSQKNKSH